MTVLDAIPTDEINLFLHELRMRRLELMPADARVVLSGGAANEMYFQWFAEHYPARAERHIAVELFSPAPDPLPEGVEWLARTVGDLSPVRDGEVDLVFAGQVIEHLWPDDVAGFLCEANRVLRPGGAVVIDSPTRFITRALGWTQPEHTVELEVDEIVELLELAGFVDIDVMGIWLCYDRERAQLLPLDAHGGGDEWPWRRRVIEADRRPRDSFIWWAEARNGASRGDTAAVARRAREIYERARPTYFERMRTEIGNLSVDAAGERFSAPALQGVLLRGPSMALPPGRHEAVFQLRADVAQSRPAPGQKIAVVEVTRDDGKVVADWTLTARDLPPGGAPREVVLPFELPDTAFDGELRVRSLGIVPLVANVSVAVRENVQRVRGPRARPVTRDLARLRTRVGLRRIKRTVGWPARRLLDPRLEGLRNHTQWMAASIVERIDARTGELGARIDELAEKVAPPRVESTPSDRCIVLPYVLGAVGGLRPGTSIAVADASSGSISLVLGSLGYNVVTVASGGTASQVPAALIRAKSIDAEGIRPILKLLQPAGMLVLIIDGENRALIHSLLDRWHIEDETVTDPRSEGGERMTLVRASLSIPEVGTAPR